MNTQLKISTIFLGIILCALYLPAFGQAEEYAYYRNGKKVILAPQPDEVFVTFASKVSLSKGITYASGLQNQMAEPEEKDVFAPVNAVRYKVNAGKSISSTALQTFAQQLERHPDIITAYPAFTLGADTLYVSNKITFVLKQDSGHEMVMAFLKNHSASLVEEIDLGDKKIYVAAISKGGDTFQLANSLFESGLVEYAEPVFTFKGRSDFVPDDSLYSLQWFLDQSNDADIDAPEAWNITTGSASVVVAVLDGHGYELSHPDLAGKIVNAYDAVLNNNSPLPQNAYANHGTPCAGLIAATTNNALGVAGVGYNVKVLPINIGYQLTPDGRFFTDEIILARAAARVIATPGVVAVSNSYMSSSTDAAATREASYLSMHYQSRGGLGAVILASTGNDNLPTPTVYPANYPFVVGVGASDQDDFRASFSNYGAHTDIVAPGVSTLTIDRTGTDGYNPYPPGTYHYFSGTSAACPIVAGVVGLMASAYPNASALNYTIGLLKSADKVHAYPYRYYYSTLPGYPYGLWNNEMGYGRVNAFKALQAMIDPPTVHSFSPFGGPAGMEVTFTGKNFIGVTSVTFNNINASFTVVNATTIKATVPPGNVSGPIRIANSMKASTSSRNFIASSYSVPGYENPCTSGDYINNFSLHTLVNNNSGCNGQTANYINYEGTGTNTTQLLRGQSYTISMQSNPVLSEGFGVWIDYNNDKDFEDAGEFVYHSPTAGKGVFTGTITVPSNVSTGLRRMRVRTKYYAVVAANESYTTFTVGETEDYTITIADPVVTTSQWNKRFGGNTTDNFSQVIRTSDGGYLLGGYSASPIGGDKTQGSQGGNDFWIVKTDASGNKQWDKRFGGSGADHLNALIATSDGGYLLGGNSSSGISGNKSQASQGGQDFWIVKISATGSKQWDKRFGGSGHDDLRTLHQLPTGEYILSGHSASGTGGDKSQASRGANDYWVVKINASGTKLWDKRFGGSSDDWLETSVLNSDGSLLLGGRSVSGLSGDKSQASRGGKDYWVVKISSAGSKVWDKRFGGTGHDEQFAMIATTDGNYLLGGLSSSELSGDKSQGLQGANDFWIVKISTAGSKLWDKRFGGSLTDELHAMARTSDGGFLLAGRSSSGANGDKSQSSRGGQDYWIVKISSTGTKQWDKRFGGSAAEELCTVLVTSDGGYLLGGRSDSGIGGDKSQASQGGTDYWLVKLSASGGTLAATKLSQASKTVKKPEIESALNRLQAYPNPFKEELTIDFTSQKAEQVQIKVYDLQGIEIKNLFEAKAEAGRRYELIWQTTLEKAGIYVIRLTTSDSVENQKVILLK